MSMTPIASRFNHVVAFEISKAELVVHSLPADRQQRIGNTGAAVRRLLERERQSNLRLGLGEMLIVCEATGGYEQHVLEGAAGLSEVLC